MQKLKTQISSVFNKTGFLPVLFLLGFLEFSAAAFSILQIDPDTKNAFVFGFSLPRIVLFAISISLGLALLWLSLQTFRGKYTERLDYFGQRQSAWLGTLAVFLTLLALLIWVTPPAWLAGLSGYFQRSRPLLIVLCAFPAQLALNWLIRKNGRPDRSALAGALFFFGLGLAFWVFVVLSGFGITQEIDIATGLTYNNVSGIPLSMFQWLSALLITLAGAVLLTLLIRSGRFQPKWIDTAIILGLYLVTALAWCSAPLKEGVFVGKQIWPYYQSFPQSDAAVYDSGAISILVGHGINFGAYTDKPIYESFLAILHLIAGYNYNLLAMLQMCFLAWMVPALYYLGKSFHSRPAGILAALVLLLRQRNAMLLASLIYYNTPPNQLMTEVPTLLGWIILTVCWFAWMKKPRAWLALAMGGALGVTSLIRLNPVLVLPVIPIFGLLVLWRDKKRWLFHTLAYLLGFTLLLAPWLMTGKTSDGQTYFLLKFYDIINVRYAEVTPPPKPVQQPVTPPAISTGTSAAAPEAISAAPPVVTPAAISTAISAATPSAASAAAPEPASTATPAAASAAAPILAPGGTPEGSPSAAAGRDYFYRFPGFVINNFTYNIVESFLVLPDSFSPLLQNLPDLGKRLYWKPDNFDLGRIPALLLNSFLVSVGLVWGWRKWKWAGMLPLVSLLVYSLSLGFGRTSGSRYLVPIDWIIFFYYGIGVLTLLGYFLPSQLSTVFQPSPLVSNIEPVRAKPRLFWAILALLLVLAAVIPVSGNLIPENASLCSTEDLSALAAQQIGPEAASGLNFQKGIVMYPKIEKKALIFSLLSCKQTITIKMTSPTEFVNPGAMVIVGWPSGDPTSEPQLISVMIDAK